MKQNNYTGYEIAVVGMSCRFPGASNVDIFWENLKNGVESISRFSDDELKQYGISEEELANPDYVKAKGIIENADLFDAAFFGLTPGEANTLDPQIRILLQCAYHALEDAGYNFGKEENNVGVFVGGIPSVNWQADSLQKTAGQYAEQFSASLLNDKDFLSSRISYLMNLHGPSSTIYTACSTSIVAIDAALQSLLTGKCYIALAGGISLSLPYKSGYTYNSGMMMSKDGNICSFDAEASGTVWGDGAGIVALKRLDDALREGDNIHAVIKGIAVNNDGNRKVGYTAYSAKGQVEVIRNAYSLAEVTPASISYIEGHGSATPLGDKIEISSLMEAFKDVEDDYRCALGSVKPNLSNLNVASGMASLIKVCLMLKHSQLPPSINFKSANSKLAEPGCPFYVNEKLSPWENAEFPLRAGISSFGIGGTNAHMILEKAPAYQETFAEERQQIICLSAKTPSALDRLSTNLAKFIDKNKQELDIDSLAFTLQTGREHFQYRKFLIPEDVKNLSLNLTKEDEFNTARDSFPIIMVFSGIKHLHPNFAKGLYVKEAYFRDALTDCLEILHELTGKELKSAFFEENELDTLHDLQVLHCLEFSFQYALAVLLNSWGIRPDYIAGYGIGEYVAACFSDVFSLRTALEILVERARLIASIDAGSEVGIRFEQVLSRHSLKKAKIPMVSGIADTWCEEDVCYPAYWVKHLSQAPLADKGLDTLTASNPNAVFFNIGTENYLDLYEHQPKRADSQLKFIEILKSNSADSDTHTSLLKAIGTFWSYGGAVDWNAYHYNKTKKKLSLPTYPFEEKSFNIRINNWTDLPSGTSRVKAPQVVKDTRPALKTPYIAPGSDLEQKLVTIWEELLGYTPIGIHDDFFQLGGNSLSMIRLISRIHKSLGVQFGIKEAFDNKTIAIQAALIADSPKVNFVHISPAPVRVNYPQSSIQKRIFILDQMNPGMTAYNVPIVFKVEGDMNVELCENAFREIISRHEALRTSFHLLDDEPVQRIHENISFKIETFPNERADLDSLTSGFIRGFDLSAPPLMRVGLKRIKNNTAYLLIDMHHIITDGISYMNLIREFVALYNDQKPEALKVQYKDYTEWQQNREKNNQLEDQRNFWLNTFKNIPDLLNFPIDFPRPQINNFKGATAIFELNDQESGQLREICTKQQVTMYTLLLTSLNVLISKLTGQEDITLGTSTAGRQHMDVERLIGAFINTLAIRNFPKGDQSFIEFLNIAKDNVLQCFANQDYSYEQLIGQLALKQDLSHNPLFDIMFEYYNYDLSAFEITNARLSQIEYTNTSSKLDLSFRVFERESDHVFYLDYRTDLFKKETIERFVAYFKNILAEVVKNIHVRLRDINILSPKEIDLLRNGYNATALPYLRDTNLVTIFEHEVKSHPERIAVCDGKKQLTYSELNEQSNKVANYLIAQGIVPGNMVGLLFERSLDMVVGIWGVLKAGGAYLPIDPTLPEQRISYMLNHSRSAFLLTQGNFWEMYTAYLPTQVIDSPKIALQSGANVSIEIQPTDIAYCIFTSGSSGRPKGVMMNHRSIINLVKGLEQEVYHLYGDNTLKVALLASFSFDASVQQIYGCLLQGHSLYISDDESRRDGEKLSRFYEMNGIDLSDGTPTHLRLLTDTLTKGTSLGNLSTWILAGEALPKDLVKEFYSKAGNKVQLYNFYGPTETCVDSTGYKVDMERLEDYPFIPIGKPLPNERIYIADTHGGLVPTGVVGELCIAGDGLAQRYVGDEAASSEKFRSNWIEGEERVYRTGDMARWLPDGNLEYRGRIDSQVKLRGYRIELLEIENQLGTHPEINYCAVDLKGTETEKFLVAYYESPVEIQASDLRHYLSNTLPDYMIPSYYMRVDKLPLTTNGKVDRNSLPVYEFKIAGDYTPPSTETEQKLVAIWAEVLKLDTEAIGITNNFFDLGGQSLKLVFLANRIKETFKVSMSLIKLASLKNIQELAKEIDASVEGDYSSVQKAIRSDFYPLSYAQKQFYLLNQLNRNSTVYNQPQAFLITGFPEREKLAAIFHGIIAHHESFRTCFRIFNDSPVQYILDDVPFELEYHHSSLEESKGIISKFIRPFDLSTAPLLRAGLIRLNEEEHILVIDRHHIISDGISLEIFMRDFMSLYQGTGLSPTQLQYRDYAVWQQGELYQENLEGQKHYWNQVFSVLPAKLALQTDYERPAITTYHGAKIDFHIESKHTQLLNDLARTLGVSLFSVVLGIFKILLYKLSGQKDLIVGTPVSGRRNTEIENIMGVFINVLAIRSHVEDNGNLYDFLKSVNQGVIWGLEHQDYPYEKLVTDLGIARDVNRNPLFDVMFVYREEEPLDFKLGDVAFKTHAIDPDTSQMDLILHVNAIENGMQLSFQYAKDLFHHSTIENFITYFKQITDQVISTTPIDAINILGVEETDLIKRFNNPEIAFEITENIVGMFEKQALAYPDRKAVVYDGLSLSYKELNEYSNQLAAYLIDQGVAKGDIVGLMLNRSADIIVGILGILKSGGAYLPIDAKLPPERISYMLESSHSRLLLGHIEHLDAFRDLIAVHDINAPSIKAYNKYNPGIERNASDLAYCIFTSGSTGNPKGVLIEDSSVVNLAEGLFSTVYTDLDSELRVGLIASYSFDASCQQIYSALLKGHCLYICKENERMDGEELYNFYKNNSINVSDGTPTHFGMFLRNLKGEINLPDLKAWLLAGEALPRELVHEFYEYPTAHNTTLYNLYGPTETCVDSTYYRIDPANLGKFKTIPIGRPLPNERIYIVDESGNNVPKGVVGELCIAGTGLARGYIGNGIENKKFMLNWIKGEERVYRSGDWAYWLPDGNIVYKGRIDNQIKLRGYRIELGEIEQALLSHPAVSESIVTVKNIEGESYLTAYYIPSQSLDGEMLREYLARHLPAYMIPSFYMQLDKMPLTANGKLDRDALPIPDRANANLYVGASSGTEMKLVEIWAEVLNMDAQFISIEQSFLQLGGNSLMAIQLANKIKREFNIEIRLVELFQKDTVLQQANFIDATLWINTGALLQETDNWEINI